MTKVSELREENLNRVRTCFSNISIWTKNELIAATGISSGGMVSILQELKERKEILQEEDAASTGGRPGHQYRLNPDAYHACCVFLKAGTEARMECFSMDLYGKRQQEKAYVISDTASVLSNIKQMLAADSSMKEILISVPGVSEEGKIRECDISFLSGCDLKQKIIAETGLVPVMENDVKRLFCNKYSLFQKPYQNPHESGLFTAFWGTRTRIYHNVERRYFQDAVRACR